MIKFILVIGGLTIVICKPFLLFLGAAVVLTWLYLEKPNSFWNLDTPKERGKEPEVDFAPGLDREEKADAEAEKQMKPGYKQDPEWQRLSKKVRDHIAKAREYEEAEMRKEEQNVKNMA